jgi:tetratricopeptide (TPR) repeat protein
MKTLRTTHTEKKVNASDMYENAIVAIQKASYEDALHLLNMYLLFEPDSVDAQLKKGLCYLYMNQTELAAEIFHDTREKNKNNAHVHACIAELFKLQFEFDIAIDFCDRAIKLCDDSVADYNLLLSELFFYKYDFDTAFTYINKAIIQCPHNEYSYYWRGLILKRFEKYDAAVNDLNKAIALYPGFSEAYRERASVRMRINEVNEALRDIKVAQHIEMDEEAEPTTSTRLAMLH